MTIARSVMRMIGVGLLLTSCVGAAVAQSAKDSLVIYTKAGRINHAVGSVHGRGDAADAGRILTVSDEIAAGEIVDTGANTQLEVLLSPGSYLRMGENSEFQLVSTSLDDIRLIVRRGSAVIETGGGPDDVMQIQVAAGGNTAVIEKRGIYRINMTPDGAQFMAINGQFYLGRQRLKVKSGNLVPVSSGTIGEVAKFDKKATQDALDIWSRERADSLAKANRQLDRKSMDLAANRYGAGDGFLGALRGQVGFWLFSSMRGYCFFVPFAPWNWQSPYGYSYTNNGGRWWLNYYGPRIDNPPDGAVRAGSAGLGASGSGSVPESTVR